MRKLSYLEIKQIVKENLKRFPPIWWLLSRLHKAILYIWGNINQEEANPPEVEEEKEQTYLAQGNTLTEQGKFEEAIANYQLAIALKPDLAAAYFYQGNALASLGKLEEAIASYELALVLNPLWAEAYLDLSNVLTQRGKFEAAIANYNKALVIQQNWAFGYFYRGNAWQCQGQYQKAIQDYQKSLDLQLDCPELYSNFSQALLSLANTLASEDRLVDALQKCQEAIAFNSNSADAYIALGNIYLQDGKKPEAIEAYKQAIALQPNWVDTYTQTGVALFLDGQYDEATHLWHRGMEIQREFAKVHRLDSLGIRFLGNSWLLAIGHIAHLDIYVKMKILGWQASQRTIMVVNQDTKVPNRYLLNHWHNYINFISEPSELNINIDWQLEKYIIDEFWAATLPNGETLWYAPAAAAVQKQWEAEKRPPLLKLSATDTERGWNCLNDVFGMPKDSWFVCLHVRESGFHQKWHQTHPGTRNADIVTYLLAIQSIVERGGWVIRVGDPTMKQLPSMEHVVDYAHSSLKSDWMDIFLCASCNFFIGTNSGLSLVPPCFGVPCALTNWAPIGIPQWYGKDIFIPKLYWSESEKHYLTFKEIFSTPVGYQQFSKYFNSINVTVVDNSPEEINDLVLEMLNRLDGTLNYTKQDERLQEEFNTLSVTHGSYIGSRIGRDFLRKYREMLPLESVLEPEPEESLITQKEEEFQALSNGADGIINDNDVSETNATKIVNDVVENVLKKQHQTIFWGDRMLSLDKSMGFWHDEKFLKAYTEVRGSIKYDQYDTSDGIAWRLNTLVWAARTALNIQGDFVECGTFKGDMAWVIVNCLDFSQVNKTFYLYDTFEGLSDTYSSPDDFVNPATFDYINKEYKLPALYEMVKNRFISFNNVRVIKGVLPDILAEDSPTNISFIHIDLNSSKAEVGVLKTLFERVTPGGIVIFDDYGWIELKQQKIAEDIFMSEREYFILELPTGQGMVIKR